jgi:hypothetical protein
LLEAQHPAGNVLLVEVVIAQRAAGSDATRLDATMLVFTGSRERTASPAAAQFLQYLESV